MEQPRAGPAWTWEREDLAKPAMRVGGDPDDAAHLEHTFSARAGRWRSGVLLRDAFMQTFATGRLAAEQGPEGVRFQPPTLRGLWDQAPSFLHDGRARTLREALLPPNHPALADGEQGFNERDGFPNTHGNTSQLSDAEVADLIAFLLGL